jgi:uncharacterized protein with beta-barrel porin domain
MANAVSPTHKGWDYDPVNARLDFYYQGTRVGHINGSGLTAAAALVATTTVTAGTGLTVTTGNTVNTAGDVRVTAGNVRLGAVSAFATTEPTSAVVMKQGTAPVGAITTSGGIFSDGTVVKKIIAAGTVSNVET